MDGTLTAEETPGGGLTMVVDLPRAPEPEPSRAADNGRAADNARAPEASS